jgi:serine/threonine protein kinase
MGLLYFGQSEHGSNVVIKTARYHGDGRDHIRLDLMDVEVEVLRLIPPHKHIVGYVDRCALRGQSYLILDFIPGPRLYESFRGRPGDPSRVKPLIGHLLHALVHIHEVDIVHRDVTPLNLIVYDPRGLVLLDFGTVYVMRQIPKLHISEAALQKALRWKNIRVGAHTWHAPEQWKGTDLEASPSSDIYGVGAVAFFMLTGREPESYVGDIGVLRSLHELNPRVDREFSSVICKAMRFNPRERYQSASDMLIELGLPSAVAQVIRRPRVVLAGVSYEVDGELELGRKHACRDDCRLKGLKSPLTIPIDDPWMFLSKHHARIHRAPDGRTYVRDLGSVNHTALKRGRSFEVLKPGEDYELKDGDVVALAYSRQKGPHITFHFRGS